MKSRPFVHLNGDFFPERLEVFIFVANELVYLHHSYVSPFVHCDMKPSNILLDQEWVENIAILGLLECLVFICRTTGPLPLAFQCTIAY